MTSSKKKIETYRHLMKDLIYKIQGNTNILVNIGCRTSGKRVSVFGFTRPGLKPTIYRTRGEHSNHYTTDAVRETRSGKMMQTAEFRLLASRCHTGNSSLPRTDMCDERRTIKVYTDSILEN
jgi:hypothetical protein